MEAKQLVKNLGHLIPSRSFCVSVQEWFYDHLPAGEQLVTHYGLSIIPGFDGSKCQRFDGHDVTELMEKVSEAFGEFCATVKTTDTDNVGVVLPINPDEYKDMKAMEA